jgi:hypothetical protein
MLYSEIIAVCSEIHTKHSGSKQWPITEPSKMLCHVVIKLSIKSVLQSKK